MAKRAAPMQQRAIETREALLLGAAHVLARIPFSQARLKDIAATSGISEGALYFHFGSKAEIAASILEAQQERMTGVLTASLAGPEPGLQELISVMRGLGTLMASDAVVQAGIKLASQPSAEFKSAAYDPYFEWIRIARTLLLRGIDDGSVRADANADSAAEFMNYAFVGAQVISEMADAWASLPERISVVESHLLLLLAPTTRD